MFLCSWTHQHIDLGRCLLSLVLRGWVGGVDMSLSMGQPPVLNSVRSGRGSRQGIGCHASGYRVPWISWEEDPPLTSQSWRLAGASQSKSALSNKCSP